MEKEKVCGRNWKKRVCADGLYSDETFTQDFTRSEKKGNSEESAYSNVSHQWLTMV